MFSNYGEENEFDEIGTGIRDVRVKYLDQEDLEELGFIYDEDEDLYYKDAGIFVNEYYRIYIQLFKENPFQIKFRSVYQSSYQDNDVEFILNIKNKSELVKFLSQ